MSRSHRLACGVLAALVLLAGAAALAETAGYGVTGVVRDATGQPVADAVVSAAGVEARTDANGVFHLALPSGEHVLRVTRAGSAPVARRVTVPLSAPPPLEITLPAALALTENVIVSAIRAGEDAPVTRTDIHRAQLQESNVGQEMPFLLAVAPSMTQYSETGAGAGYSYFSLRGMQQTRVNMTFDGAPLNEPEDSALYFVNFGNLAAALQSVQIQRGVGASTFGAASFAGSVNFVSLDAADARSGEAQLIAGALGTRRASLAWQSGRLGERFKFSVRGSQNTTDGYREHSGVDQSSVFFGGVYEGDRSVLRISGFVGHERTQLASYAVDPDTLAADPRANPLSPEEHDSFGQHLVQATWTRPTGPSSSLAIQAYHHGAGGWYRFWDSPDIRQVLTEYNLDWGFAGLSASWRREAGDTTLLLGANVVDDRSTHAGHAVIGAAAPYTNHGYKTEGSAFVKASWRLSRWKLFADLQVRRARFRYAGDVGSAAIAWNFFNPKLGARYTVSRGLSLFVSAGGTTREPTRGDLLLGEDNATVVHDFRAVKPERVVDLETGLDLTGDGVELHANLYDMEFRDEIALTGELSDTYLPLRRNVDRSYRRGAEIDARWQVVPRFSVALTAAASRNRIRTWTQFYDVYEGSLGGESSGTTSRTFHDVAPLLTPEFIGRVAVVWKPAPGLTLDASASHTARSHLDNTDAPGLETPPFTLVGAQATVELGRRLPGRPKVRFLIVNLLDERRAWPSGYSYLYVVRGADGKETPAGVPYYYPLAGRAAYVGLDLSW